MRKWRYQFHEEYKACVPSNAKYIGVYFSTGSIMHFLFFSGHFAVSYVAFPIFFVIAEFPD